MSGGRTAAAAAACLLLGAWSARVPGADVTRRPLAADDVYRLVTVSDPQVSPDGSWVVYVATRNDRQADEPQGAVWMVSWDGTQRLALTTPRKGTHAPRFSPDGRFVTFLADTAGSGHAQVMMLDRRGGAAAPLTGPDDDVDDYAWSPDGRRIALVMQAREERTPPHAVRPIIIDSLHFKQDEEGYLGVGQERHLYLLDVATRRVEVLTGGRGVHDRLPAWSPDGRRIAFVRTHEPDADVDGRQDIELIDAQAGAPARRLIRIDSPNRQRLAWSADGTTIAHFLGEDVRYNQYIQNRVALASVADGSDRPLGAGLDRPVSSFAFGPDPESIWATVDDDGRAYAARLGLASRGNAVEALAEGPFVLSSISAAAGHAALLYSDDAAPAEVYALDAGKLRRLTAHNEGWLAGVRLGRVEDWRFRSRDGTDIHGLLVKPALFAAGRRHPTVLWIHGGPNGQDAHALAGGDQFRRQLLAADGFLAVGINYRGSSARGRAFARAIVADWGHLEIEDLQAGIDDLVGRGVADPSRLGIGGWSYGAILTDFMIARDGRFKAAVSGAGSADTLAMYGADEYVLQYNNELGTPWTHAGRWLTLSFPFLHADRIHTPTLFMGGSRDFDVPLGGGEQMYQALRTLGVPTGLVVYPGEFHALQRPSFIEDRSRRISTWFTSRLMSQQ